MRSIWIILVLLTLFAFLVGWLKLVNSLFVSILLLTTFIKGQLVSEYFMGLKRVTLNYRVIPTIWLFIVLSSIAIAYYLPISN
ncbi:cytochrome C oxidase subunit IV family protein [Sulfurovum sp.]|uniref:cytochrome C oxidase subunit IV family protein n=1 Tax=Sulfurovum sp. TaxID=1969726 RepID=UPI003562A22E